MILDPMAKLEIVLAGAVASNQLTINGSFRYWNDSGDPTKPAAIRKVTTDTADVTLIAAPQTGFLAELIDLSVYNKDTATATPTIKTDDGTERIDRKVSLLTLETLNYERGRGWYCLDANGNTKEVAGSVFSSITAGTISQTVPNTQTGATYTVAANDYSIIANRAGTITLTLPSPSVFPGRILRVQTIQAQTVVSASSNVVPIAGGAAGTAILAATAGKFAELQSDATNWQIIGGN